MSTKKVTPSLVRSGAMDGLALFTTTILIASQLPISASIESSGPVPSSPHAAIVRVARANHQERVVGPAGRRLIEEPGMWGEIESAYDSHDEPVGTQPSGIGLASQLPRISFSAPT